MLTLSDKEAVVPGLLYFATTTDDTKTRRVQWSATTLKKERACSICGTMLQRGAGAYRSLTSAFDSHRLCKPCMTK